MRFEFVDRNDEVLRSLTPRELVHLVAPRYAGLCHTIAIRIPLDEAPAAIVVDDLQPRRLLACST